MKLARMIRRLSYWMRFRSGQKELREELELHRDLLADDLKRRGLAPSAARDAARRTMGNETLMREDARGVWLAFGLESGLKELQHAVRSLARARAFSIATIATIALAVGAGCAVFGLVEPVLLRPLPYPSGDRLVGLWHTLPGLHIETAKLSPGTYNVYRDDARSFEDMGLYVSLAATLTYRQPDAAPERVRIAWMTPSAFSVLGARPLVGRLFSDADAAPGAPPVAVISERLWKARFGGTSAAIGQTIDVDGAPRQIVGVMPRTFAFPNAAIPVWAPFGFSNISYVRSFGYDGIGRLKPGVTVEEAQRELVRLLPRLPARYPELRPGVSTALTMRQSRMAPIVHHMRDDVVAGFDRVLWLFAGTVALLLVVAASNVASLMLVRVESRQRELAVRTALGADRWMVMRSLAAEAALLATAGGAIGLALAVMALRLIVRVAPQIPRANEIHAGGVVTLAAVVLTVAFVLLGATMGVARVRPSDAMRILRDGGRTGTGGRGAQRMRSAFVVAEVALSLVLLAGSGVLARSVAQLREVQPGFDPTNVFTFWTFLPPTSYRGAPNVARFYREAVDRFQRLPGVVSVAATDKVPLEVEGFPYEILIWADDGSPPSVIPPAFQTARTSSGYFGTMRIPLIAGRSYDDANVQRGVSEAVVSRGFVDHFWHDSTGRSGVGKRLRISADGHWFTIVGVVGDVRDSTIALPPISEAYFPEEAALDTVGSPAATTVRDMAFVVRTRGAQPGVPAMLERELHAMDPNLPFHRPAAMEQIVTDARSGMTFALALLTFGAAATLALGIVGLYGVIAYVVSLRSREISIRIALGLEPNGATWMIVRQGEWIIGVGLVLGVSAFVGFARLLESFVFGVRAVDAVTIGGAAIGVLVVATVAVWMPARRAAKMDAAEVLGAS